MPAQEEEVVEALEEGVRLVDGAMAWPVAASTTECLALECQLVTLDPEAPRACSARCPMADGFLLEADAVIVAIGQDPDLAPFAGCSRPTAACADGRPGHPGHQRGRRVRRRRRGRPRRATSLWPSERAGGRPTPSPPSWATRTRSRCPTSTSPRPWTATEVNTYYFPPAERTEKERCRRPSAWTTFARSTRALRGRAGRVRGRALHELRRLHRVRQLLHLLSRHGHQEGRPADEHYVVLDQYCKGCGLCVAECPRGAVHLEEEVR